MTNAPKMRRDSSHVIVMASGTETKVLPCRFAPLTSKFEDDVVIEFTTDDATFRLVLTPSDALKMIQKIASGLQQ